MPRGVYDKNKNKSKITKPKSNSNELNKLREENATLKYKVKVLMKALTEMIGSFF